MSALLQAARAAAGAKTTNLSDDVGLPETGPNTEITPLASSSSPTHDHVRETLSELDVPHSPSSPSHHHVPETVLESNVPQ